MAQNNLLFVSSELLIYEDIAFDQNLYIGGRVQTTWTEFWAILTPYPYVDTFTK